MHKIILQNKITLLTEKTNTNTIVIAVNANVGSNHESEKIFGISHFLEHMLFEGTKKRPNAGIISNEIECLGGEFNAYTSNERTLFYIRTLSKHFDTALEIISDMVSNSIFVQEFIEKERKVILKEINMVTDEPRFHQWILFQKALFKKHPARNPTYGTVKTVNSISRNDLINYFRKHYSANNLSIAVVGNFTDENKIIKNVADKFSRLKAGGANEVISADEPEQKSPVEKIEKRSILNSYMVLGYRTPARETYESYVLDVVKAIFARGQSGKIVEAVRIKKGLAYEVNLLHDSNKGFGMFAVHLNSDKKNIPKIKKIIFDEFRKLKTISKNDIDIAKGFIEGHYLMDEEDNFKFAEKLLFWEQIKDAKLHYDYIGTIKKVAKEDILRVAGKYINENYTMVRIE